MRKPKIVILGAGYGGLMTATRLQKAVGANDAEIILVNKNDYHYETTWLHEASAGTLHHDRVRYDISKVIDNSKIEFVKGTAVEIKTEEKKVLLEKGELEYDYLVVSLGGESETFGIKGLKEYAFSISNVNSARQIREHIEYQFATYNTEKEKDDTRLTIVVGGAGFTGIEFLGELGNRIPELCKEYDVDFEKVKVICVEAAPMVLPGFDPELVEYAVAHLEKKGVQFRIGTAIKEGTPDGIIVAKGENDVEEIKAGTVVWAAGIRGNAIIEKSGFEAMRGRVKVDANLRAPGHDNIFIIGDSSLVINEEIDRPYPPTAQIAMQQGEVVARNLAALLHNKELETFKYDNKGTVCSLGDDDAIGVAFGKKLVGTKASFMKKMIDNRALYMIGGASLVAKKGKFNVLK
ncbi:NAD(P)/FAD-dependent oxidoreductase [Cytobacillus horneckiae]|uniref:NAD(P)/FAD-dependent oxidoreductase n=1 Tax=Cytobacillus horneckiae TaxID=549687 RepID=A0A2N0ZE94_9BACI|nr:NAD(P)/FAD-dependent oxidoreductase [Cytobacillus horneckiae]MCM3180742.1 NAD(P)/FAD-dependent oxidoreductase [Cytobacillus horneckiae]MEC1157552.1 NAD(P)/FAD-dependent oxidoreductase [Cytobacillus horneckiae]MED2939500.1 NAD(P)/FAD-dependent oxidoreductase [Cytobacillus horneckiae]PKG27830.1 NAD(P)/FAD-dependent oxidoreductase [Cytobacillus horneckiae]